MRGRAPHLVLLALVGLFLAGHVWGFAPAPTDIDEANFVLAVRRFDVASHRPHPPGYPVFVALGKFARPLAALAGPAPLAFGGPAAVEARALALWSVVFGAAGLVAFYVFAAALDDRRDVVLAATAFTAAAPLYWFTAARPLSDVPGLAAVLAVDALLVEAWRRQRPRLLVTAAAVAGLAAGLRSQTLWLLAPLFFVVVAWWGGPRLRLLAAAGSAWVAGVAVWMVPLLLSTGGLARYLELAGWQAVEDLAYVEMLARRPSVEGAVKALQLTLGGPWATREMALVMLGLAALGCGALAARGRRAARTGVVLAAAFAPYAGFHLLFQESETTRYALPLVPPVAYLAAAGLAWVVRRGLPVAAAALVVALGFVTLPSFAHYVRTPSPIFAALDALSARLAASATPAVVTVHQPFRRALDVVQFRDAPVLKTLAGREVSVLAERWLAGETGPAFLLNDPRKGPIRLIDRASRELTRFRWSFRRERFLRGIRPDEVDLVEFEGMPGWFCAEGWALTPDTGGLLHPERRAPQIRPAVAYVRRRPEAAVLVVGGHHRAPRTDPRPALVTVAVDGRDVASWTVRADPDRFLHFVPLEAGRLLGDGPFATVTVRATGPEGFAPPVGLEQFDVQSVERPVWGYDDGWYLPEFDPRTGELWRWTSARAVIRVRPGASDLVMLLEGQSPLAERGDPPEVTIRAGRVEVARLRPPAEFRETVRIPRAALETPEGVVVIETDRVFVPADWGIGHDRRRLGVRIFEVQIR